MSDGLLNYILTVAFLIVGFFLTQLPQYRRGVFVFIVLVASVFNLNGGNFELGWLYATCPDEKYRDGQQAIEHATKTCEQTEWKDNRCLAALAAAYAEAGNFVKAVELQTKAIEEAGGAKTGELIFRPQLDRYKAGKPYQDDRKHQ